MEAQRLVNSEMEVLCILVCIILLIQQPATNIRRETDRWFKAALLANIGMLLGDISDWTLSGSQAGYAPYLLISGMTLYYASSGVLMFCFLAYVHSYLSHKVEFGKFPIWIGKTAMFIQIIAALLSPVTGLIFQIGPGNYYQRGKYFLISQSTSVIVLLIAIGLLAKAWQKLRRKERFYLFFYLSVPFIAEIFQVFCYEIAVLNIALTLALLLVNLFISSEIDERLYRSGKQLEKERLEALRAQQEGQKKLIDQTIVALSNAVEAKDHYTNGHSRRVAWYAREIVRRMGWDEEQQQKMYYAGLLHDVGKIRVPDHLINKAARLDEDEYEIIKLHTLTGYYILKEISSIADFAIVARWHHERYDGKGYPNGLSGENIPLIARVIGVADAYDAMTSNRSYRSIMSQERVRQELVNGMGTQFDPKIAKIMLEMIEEDTAYRLRQPSNTMEQVILAIDDDPMVLKLLNFTLQMEGDYRLITVPSGEQGIEVMEREPVDLVLLDVEMKGKNGFDVLAWIRKNREMLPVIFMTGDRELEMIQRAEQMGISDYLTKPLVPRVLRESMQNVLQNSKNFL